VVNQAALIYETQDFFVAFNLSSKQKLNTSMASTSSNTSPVSNKNVLRYDVFLSFRDETRHAFTDHLYTALLNAGLTPFRDNDDIDRGEDLQPEIERGIRESRASIVVLSKHYATSRWCLDELCLINNLVKPSIEVMISRFLKLLKPRYIIPKIKYLVY